MFVILQRCNGGLNGIMPMLPPFCASWQKGIFREDSYNRRIVNCAAKIKPFGFNSSRGNVIILMIHGGNCKSKTLINSASFPHLIDLGI